jgi:hypothetical protein
VPLVFPGALEQQLRALGKSHAGSALRRTQQLQSEAIYTEPVRDLAPHEQAEPREPPVAHHGTHVEVRAELFAVLGPPGRQPLAGIEQGVRARARQQPVPVLSQDAEVGSGAVSDYRAPLRHKITSAVCSRMIMSNRMVLFFT